MSTRPGPVTQSWARMSGSLLIAGAVIGLVGNALHPHTAELDAAAAVQAIAGNGAWVAIHVAIIIAILLIVGGLVGFADEMSGTSGEALARLGLAAALLGGAVVTVSLAIDGFGLRTLAVASLSANAADAALALRIWDAANRIDFGVWSMGMLTFFGLSFGCFGGAVIVSRRFPLWFGVVAVVGAAGSALAAFLQIGAGDEVQAAETVFLASSLILTLWVMAAGVLMWRAGPLADVSPVSRATSVDGARS